MKTYELRKKNVPEPTSKLGQFFRRRSVRYAIPFLLAIVGGSIGLREFTQIRYQFSNVSSVKRDELEKFGIKKKEEVTVESEFEKIKELDIDNWEQVRGPRPWEESTLKK